MTQPTEEITDLARRWGLDIDMNVPGVPDWQTLFGVEEFKPIFEQRMEGDEGYDDQGGNRDAITGAAERLEITVKRRKNAAGTWNAVHEYLRQKSRAVDAIAGEIHVRWYDLDGRPEAYDARAIVTWTPNGGNGAARDTVAVVIRVQGRAVAIANPNASTLPVVTGLVPAGGPVAGGNQVIIKGGQLTGATAVTFGGTAATSFVVVDDTRIVAVAPAKVAGNADVIVTTPGGVSVNTAADNYLYA